MRIIERGDMVSFDTDFTGPYGYCCDVSRSWVCGGAPTRHNSRTETGCPLVGVDWDPPEPASPGSG